MADVPELTDSQAAILRCLTAGLVDLVTLTKDGMLDDSGSDITPKGREALAAYDAKQRRGIRVEAMWECLGALIRLANRSDATIGLGVRAACDAVGEVLDAEEASNG